MPVRVTTSSSSPPPAALVVTLRRTGAALRWSVIGLALGAVLLLAAASSAQAASRRSAVPPRDLPGQPLVSDAQLWSRAVAAAPRAAPKRAVSFIVGLKAPGANRGIWRDRMLIDKRQRGIAEAALARRAGVRLLGRDAVLPAVTVELRDVRTLRAVRRLPFVDYVNSLYVDLRPAGFGCSSPALDPNSSARDSAGLNDVLPWSFPFHRITDAWNRLPGGPGAGVTVGVIDTGVARAQSQLQMPEFAAEQSAGRTVSNLGSNVYSNDSPWGACNHGTRMAGLIAAPRDGISVVGAAWRSNLITVHTQDSVVIGSDNAHDIVRGIRKAVGLGPWSGNARIITLAFGNPIVTGDMYLIEDQIRSIYYGNIAPGGVLFVGAAGTDFCLFGLAWPGYLPEVLTVAGVATDRHTPSNGSCAGDAVDIAAVVGDGDVETTGLNRDEIIGLGGSSGATATIAGIAALIWSKYPTWNRDQVRQRLLASGQGYRSEQIGYGVPDAYKAVGGLTSLRIAWHSAFEPGLPYTLGVDTGLGEGPFTYRWSTGATTPTVTRTLPVGARVQTTSVTVTDSVDQTSLTSSVTVRPPREGDPPCGIHCPRDPESH